MKFLILLLIFTSLLFSTSNKPNFTKEELEWIKQNPVVVAGSGDDWAPFNFVDRFGKFKGITEDYLKLVEKKSGLKIKRDVGKWSEVLDRFKNGKIDFLPAALYQKEREKFGKYIKAHIKLRDFIYTRADNKEINSFDDLNGKTLVRIRGYAVLDPYLKHLNDVKILEVNNTLDMINAVYNKKANALLESQATINFILKENMIGGFKSIAQSVSSPTTAHFLVRKDSPMLYSILEKTLFSITEQEHQEIFNRWISLKINENSSETYLTQEQVSWIKKHPVIKVGVEKDWAPYDFIDDKGEYQGIARDYLEHIAKETGLKFEYYPEKWSNLLEKIKNKELDLLPALYYSKKRSKYISFSESYLKIPEYLYTRKEASKVDGIEALYGKKIAVVSGYFLLNWLKEKHPEIEIVETESLLKALQAVQTKEAFGFIGDEGSANYAIQSYMLSGLKINNIIKSRSPASVYMGSRKDYKTLAGIITNVIDYMPRQQHNSIKTKWIGSELSNKKLKVDLILNKKEKKWLKTNPVIRYSEVTWEPLSIIEKNKMSGIMGDYLQYVSDATGIRFEYLPAKSYKEVLEMFARGEIDLIPNIGGSKQERALGNVTNPYVSYPMVAVTRSEIQYIDKLDKFANKRFTAPKYFTSHNYIVQNYPDSKIVSTDTIRRINKTCCQW